MSARAVRWGVGSVCVLVMMLSLSAAQAVGSSRSGARSVGHARHHKKKKKRSLSCRQTHRKRKHRKARKHGKLAHVARTASKARRHRHHATDVRCRPHRRKHRSGRTGTTPVTGTTPGTGTGPGTGPGTVPTLNPSEPEFFSPTSIWNAPLPANAPIDPNSGAIVNTLLEEEAVSQSRKSDSITTNSEGVPIYVVPANQPTVTVHLNQGPNSADLQDAFDAVPIPSDAVPAPGTDENLAVYQPSTNLLWEFWRMVKTSDGWEADWGGKLYDVTDNPGYYQNMVSPSGAVLEQPSWGATATSFPVVAGVMTIAELQAGVIPHALALAITTTCSQDWAAPAQRTDGDSSDAGCVPEGAHFRLDPSLNLASLDLPPTTLLMAEAAQKYGIIIDNSSHGFTFRTEDPQQFEAEHGYSPYYGPQSRAGTPGALFSDWSPALVNAFPWKYLELLQMNLQTTPDTTPVPGP